MYRKEYDNYFINFIALRIKNYFIMKKLEVIQMESVQGGDWLEGMQCASLAFFVSVVTANPVAGLVYGVACQIGHNYW